MSPQIIIQHNKNNLEIGNQPICKYNIILICNGEIYNYKEIAKELELDYTKISVDCEIIIDLYLKKGAEEFSKLDGDFVFILYDKNKNQIITSRDYVGLKPLYIGKINDKINSISSEIKVLEKLGCDSIVSHPIGEYILINSIDMNIIRNTKLIDYEYIMNTEIENNDEKIKSNIKKYLTNAVKKRIEHTNRPYAFLCSGGIDSSLILTIAADILGLDMINIIILI